MADGSSLAAGVLSYLVFALAAVALPGAALQRLLGLPIDAALVLPLGMAAAAASYWLSLVAGWPWLFPLLLLLLCASLARAGWRTAPGASLRGALAPIACALLLLALAEYHQNRREPDGAFAYDSFLPEDAAFHVGLAFELAHGYPPQIPGLSGFRLDYHLGVPLLRAAAVRWAGLHPYDLLSRCENTLFAVALILALRGAAWALSLPPRAVALSGFAPFVCDASFVLGFLRGFERGPGWADQILPSLAHANSTAPALALALSLVIALERRRSAPAERWLAASLLASLALPFFKVFTAAQLLLGAAAALLVAGERRATALAAAPAALVTAVLVLGSGGRTMEVLLDPLLVVRYWALDLRLPSGGALLPVFALVWAVESLGLRAAGLREAARALRGGSAGRAMLAATALCGWPLGLLLRISPAEATSRERPFNEALYFFEQSGPLLWLFAAAALAGLRLRRPAAALLACACAGLALPGTVAWAASEWRRPPGRLNAPVVQAMDALARASAPGDVVLMRPELQRFPPPPLVLAGRRVPLSFYVTFLNQFVEQRARRARLEEVRAFFATADPGRARAVARGLGAGYVCFFGVDGPAFDTRAAGLEAIFEAATVRVYRLGSGP